MQSLSQSQNGTYTIKWMIGLSDISEQLASFHIAEGNTIPVFHDTKKDGSRITAAALFNSKRSVLILILLLYMLHMGCRSC